MPEGSAKEGRRRAGLATQACGGAKRPSWGRQPGEGEGDWVVGEATGRCRQTLGERNWGEVHCPPDKQWRRWRCFRPALTKMGVARCFDGLKAKLIGGY